jgi:acetoin utilization deacetylase AcuC-like enzyme
MFMSFVFVLCLTCIHFVNFKDIGEKDGKYYAINVPLKDGIDDKAFTRLFRTVSLHLIKTTSMSIINYDIIGILT